jgi:hypothetical protein
MLNILSYILIGIVGITTVACCAYLTLAIPAIIIWKFYRKIRYGLKLYD